MQQQAIDTLNRNWRNGYTIPSGRLYPFQWNWDSGLIAIGLAHFNPERALDEIRYMFKGQWQNGMLPHINFHHLDENYFPGPDVWATSNLPISCNTIQTSGITQPPVFGFVLQRIYEMLEGKLAGLEDFIKEIFPKVVASHRYLYENRDPNREGLVYIHHNWESGTDNSPIWDDILYNIDVTGVRDVSALRRDIKNVDASQRPTNENYQRYIYLIDLFIKHSYNDADIVKNCPFLVQDVLFNALLVKSNNGLIALAEKFSLDATEIIAWNQKTIHAINTKLWSEKDGIYYAYDLRNEKSITIKTSSAFLPLFAQICSEEQAVKLAIHLTQTFIPDNDWLLCPSTAANEPAFNPLKYWRGPVWINVNWMLYHGLLHYGYNEAAEQVKRDTIFLVENYGHYEYFDPRPEKEALAERGIGADAFSWTAALYLDLLNNTKTI